MNRIKTLKSIIGKKAYADGHYGFIKEFTGREYMLDLGVDGYIYSQQIRIIDKLHFLFITDNIIVAIAVVDGETYAGCVVCSPRDGDEEHFAKRLALARAFGDEREEDNILDQMSEWQLRNYGDENTEEKYTIVKTEEFR